MTDWISTDALSQKIRLEREGSAFLEVSPVAGKTSIVPLPDRRPVSIGRDSECDVAIEDDKVSRLHFQLEWIGGSWVAVDDGLSRNGTFVGGERLRGRRRLEDGDAMRVGDSLAVFRDPRHDNDRTAAEAADTDVALTETQRKVLVALCRPFRDGSEFAAPASNVDIAAEVFLSVDAVKSHLRVLFDRFGVVGLPQNQKRLRLAELALRGGAVSPRELR